MGVPTPNGPHYEKLLENCPDCGRRPITGQFVYLGQFEDPTTARARFMEARILDVRAFGNVLAALIDWTCSDTVCQGKKSYVTPPVMRLAARAADAHERTSRRQPQGGGA